MESENTNSIKKVVKKRGKKEDETKNNETKKKSPKKKYTKKNIKKEEDSIDLKDFKNQESNEEIVSNNQESNKEVVSKNQETKENLKDEKQESKEEVISEKQESKEDLKTEKQESKEDLETEKQEMKEELKIKIESNIKSTINKKSPKTPKKKVINKANTVSMKKRPLDKLKKENKKIKLEETDIVKEEIIEDLNNSYIEELIKETKEEIINQHIDIKLEEIITHLKDTMINEYTIEEIKESFSKFKENVLLVQIKNNKLSYLEKKSTHKKNSQILNILHELVNKYLINDVSFIIDTNNNNIDNDKNYILRLNKEKKSKNILLPYYLPLKLSNLEWENKKDSIFIHKNYVSEETLNKLKNNKFELKENNDLEDLERYKYILFEKNDNNIDELENIFKSKAILVLLNNNNLNETFMLNKLEKNEDYILIDEYENEEDILNIIQTIQGEQILNSLNDKILSLTNEDALFNYLKDIMYKLSIKCEHKEIINNRIFCGVKQIHYLYDRLNIDNNSVSFHFQGSDYDLVLNDQENKINIVVNQFSSNIYFNGNNIFNFLIPNLVNHNQSSHFHYKIINSMLFLHKNHKLVLKCALPEIFNIEKIGLRNYHQDSSWWIC